jgi:DNA (cytosine-5)-methyltransferase 1
MTKTRVIDLFAGIGGFHTAFHNLGAEIVFASEWDEHARKTYTANYEKVSPHLFTTGSELYAGDITKVNPNNIPDFDVLCGGFPCQPFSLAGKREGLQDTRGTLFFDIANILQTKKPAAFFLENVRGLLSHDDGKTFATIQSTIDSLGYSFHYQVVKASDFNVPQARPRLFMVGFRKELNDLFGFPEQLKLTNTLDKVLGGKVTTVSGEPRKIGFTLRVGGRNSGVHDRRNWDSYIVNGVERQITLEEGVALQGFPAGFIFPVSTTQAFKQLGNSVAVPAIQATAQQIIQELQRISLAKTP